MNNRFGLKDLVLMVLLVLVLVVLFLGMKQVDRQWDKLQAINHNLEDQGREIAQLRRAISSGVSIRSASGGQASTQPAADDPFKYVKEAEAKPDYATGDWLVDAFYARIPVLTPLISQDYYSKLVQARVVEWLAYRDPYTLEYIPALASSWKISPDGMSITFQLRRGVVFSDGQPFTADDVVFSFKLPMNPSIAAPRYRGYYEKIGDVVKINDYEVVFKFKEPYFDSFDLASGLEILPKHFYEKFKPEEINQSTGLLMGTGPYKLKDPTSWKPGEPQIELVRNDRYWGEPGPFDKIIWRIVEQESAALTMFKNGQLDLFAASPEQYREMLRDSDLLKHTRHMEYVPVTAGFAYIAWNQKQGGKTPTPFADKRVRQALTLLIDRERLVREVMLGYAKTATGPFAAASKQRDPEIKPWPFDPQRAKALLKEAGFEDRDGDGVLESPQGEPFRFKLSYLPTVKISEQTVLFVKDGLAKAGIVCEPDPQNWPILMKKMTNRDFDAITAAWSGVIENDIYQLFDSSQIADNGDNYMSYSNPKLDKLMREARSTIDEGKRIPLWRECHRIINDDQPYTFLFDRMALAFFDDRIQNIELSKVGLNYISRWAMPIPWYVPKARQKWK